MRRLESLLACPVCLTNLRCKLNRGYCINCRKTYTKRNGIWNLLFVSDTETQKSAQAYNEVHESPFQGPPDGSYDIFAAFARGNTSLDIACGDGLIEQLSKDTVGVDFSLNALKKAARNGVRNLVLADAHHLPFKNGAFDLSICAGSLEHFADPEKAISEMARVSKIQLLTVHSSVLGHDIFTKILRVKHQPIERPIGITKLEKMLQGGGLHIVFKGVWTLPLNFGRVIKWLPEFPVLPSSSFVITRGTSQNKS